MPIMQNARRVVKKFRGTNETFTDTSTWVLLKNGTDVTGTVLFRDNGDGTASLAGGLQVQGVASKVVLYPPAGYAFVATHWDRKWVNLGGIGNFGGMGGGISPKVVDGNLTLAYTGTNGATYYAITFQQGMLNSTATSTTGSDPALIDIKNA